jgi:hypothetical protein
MRGLIEQTTTKEKSILPHLQGDPDIFASLMDHTTLPHSKIKEIF